MGKGKCTYIEVDDILIDFNYGSITATMDRDNKCLTQAYECYDKDENLIKVIYCEVVEFN